MAFTRPQQSAGNNNSSSEPAKIGGYINVGIVGRDGVTRRLGRNGAGIALREDHEVEGKVLEFLRQNGIDALGERLSITFNDNNRDEFEL